MRLCNRMPPSWPYTFTHNDLTNVNIMVDSSFEKAVRFLQQMNRGFTQSELQITVERFQNPAQHIEITFSGFPPSTPQRGNLIVGMYRWVDKNTLFPCELNKGNPHRANFSEMPTYTKHPRNSLRQKR